MDNKYSIYSGITEKSPGLTCKGTIIGKKAKQYFPAPRGKGKPLIEQSIKRFWQDQGFQLDDEIDNKSVVDLEQMYQTIARFGSKIQYDIDEKVLSRAFSITWKDWAAYPGERLFPIPWEEEDKIKSAMKLDKASGYPFFAQKDEVFSKDLERAKRWCSGLKAADPYVCYQRVQHGPDGPKTRPIWGGAQSTTIGEARFARPMIEKLNSGSYPVPYRLFKYEIASRLDPIENSGLRYCVDFSKFDASVHPKIISFAFMVVKSYFELDEQDEVAFSQIVHNFIHSIIVMPCGRMFQKRRGIPSGSYFTQVIGSICNYVILQYAVLKLTDVPIQRDRILVVGDDSVFSTPSYISLAAFAEACSDLGMTVSIDKSDVVRFPKPLHFIGHYWNSSNLPFRQEGEVQKRTSYPERWTEIEDARLRVKTRMAAYLADDINYHPWFIRWRAERISVGRNQTLYYRLDIDQQFLDSWYIPGVGLHLETWKDVETLFHTGPLK